MTEPGTLTHLIGLCPIHSHDHQLSHIQASNVKTCFFLRTPKEGWAGPASLHPHLYMPRICSSMRQQLFLGFCLWNSFFLQIIASCKCSVLFQIRPRGTCLQIQTSGIIFRCSFLKMLLYVCWPTSIWEFVMLIKYQNMKLLKHRFLFTLEIRVRTRIQPHVQNLNLHSRATKLEQGLQKLRTNFQLSLKLQTLQ